MCSRLRAWQELSFDASEPGAARVDVVPEPDEDLALSRVWIGLDLALFQDAIWGLDLARSSQLFGRWISRVDRSRLWGLRKERISCILEELPRLGY